MIRFIDLGKQIAGDKANDNWPREFAFYDTLEASFVSFGGQQIFDSVADLKSQMEDDDLNNTQRILKLIPEWVPKERV